MAPKITHYEPSDEKDPSEGSKADVVLYTNPICPFVQRVRIALYARDVDYDAVTIDLQKPRPDWYLKNVNYRGKVPSLSHKGKIMVESSPLVEYVDEAFTGGKQLFPQDPYKRQISRVWIQFCGDTFIPAFYSYLMEQNKDNLAEKKEKALKAFTELEDAIAKYQGSEGPFFFGSEFSAVDATVLPFLERVCVLEHYKNFSIPDTCPRVQRWIKEAPEKSEAFKSTMSDPEVLIKAYEKYAKK